MIQYLHLVILVGAKGELRIAFVSPQVIAWICSPAPKQLSGKTLFCLDTTLPPELAEQARTAIITGGDEIDQHFPPRLSRGSFTNDRAMFAASFFGAKIDSKMCSFYNVEDAVNFARKHDIAVKSGFNGYIC